MIPYIVMPLIILVLSALAKGKSNRLLIATAFVVLALFAGLRGNFTTDYDEYCRLFVEVNGYSSLI